MHTFVYIRGGILYVVYEKYCSFKAGRIAQREWHNDIAKVIDPQRLLILQFNQDMPSALKGASSVRLRCGKCLICWWRAEAAWWFSGCGGEVNWLLPARNLSAYPGSWHGRPHRRSSTSNPCWPLTTTHLNQTTSASLRPRASSPRRLGLPQREFLACPFPFPLASWKLWLRRLGVAPRPILIQPLLPVLASWVAWPKRLGLPSLASFRNLLVSHSGTSRQGSRKPSSSPTGLYQTFSCGCYLSSNSLSFV